MKDVDIKVGEYVVIDFDHMHSLYPDWYPDVPSTVKFEGTVVGRAEFDPIDSIRITGSGRCPVRVISFSKVKAWNGIKIDQPAVKNYVPKVFKIAGKKGAQYELRVSDTGQCSCTCPGYGFRKTCSHITKFKEQGIAE